MKKLLILPVLLGLCACDNNEVTYNNKIVATANNFDITQYSNIIKAVADINTKMVCDGNYESYTTTDNNVVSYSYNCSDKKSIESENIVCKIDMDNEKIFTISNWAWQYNTDEASNICSKITETNCGNAVISYSTSTVNIDGVFGCSWKCSEYSTEHKITCIIDNEELKQKYSQFGF